MEYKIQAVKLAKELGGAKATSELCIPENTMYALTKVAREGSLQKAENDVSCHKNRGRRDKSMIPYRGREDTLVMDR